MSENIDLSSGHFPNVPGSIPTPPERVVAILPGFMKPKAFVGHADYTVVITDRRTIFARVTKTMLKKAEAQAPEGNRRGILPWRRDRSRAVFDHGRYWTMPPDEIVRETPDNFALDNSSVSSIRVRAVIPFTLDYDPEDMMKTDLASEQDDIIREMPDNLKSKRRMRNDHQDQVDTAWEVRIEAGVHALEYLADYDPRETLSKAFEGRMNQGPKPRR